MEKEKAIDIGHLREVKPYEISRQWDHFYFGAPGQTLEEGDDVDRIGFVDENKRIESMLYSGKVLDLIRGRWMGSDSDSWTGSHYRDQIDLIDYSRWIMRQLETKTYDQVYDQLKGKTPGEIKEMVDQAKKEEVPGGQQQ